MQDRKITGNPVRTILFDMDNTLHDLVGAQRAACRAVVRELGGGGGEELFSYFLRDARGFESHENIRDYMLDRGCFNPEAYARSCRIYDDVKLASVVPYPGVTNVIPWLKEKGYKLGLVTDAHIRDTLLRLEKSGLIPFFDQIVTFDMAGVKKPSTVPFRIALEKIGSGPHETLFVGDSPHRDLAPCRALGIRTVYARYGDRFSHGRGEVDTDFVIGSVRELPGILGSNETGRR